MNEYPDSKKTLMLGLVLAALVLGAWEVHVRSNGYIPDPDDDKGLWAEKRAQLEQLGPDDVVLIGSSRVLFDIQLDEWEAITGKRPLMLAAAGSAPLPVFQDIVERSNFSGTVIYGVTPPLQFGPMDRGYHPYGRIANWVDHYHDRTYAQRLNHALYKIPQRNLAFLDASEEPFYTQLDLGTLISRLDMHSTKPPRTPGPPDWPAFARIDGDRNITMLDFMRTDSAKINEVTGFWSFILKPPPEMIPPKEVQEQLRKAVIGTTAGLTAAYQARGGKVIFLRCPSQALFRYVENAAWPRAAYWDEMVEAANSPAYHFEDYEFMNRYVLPEWSHLASDDAKAFTRDLVLQLRSDGVL